MLHIVNKSPFESSGLESCLRTAQPGAAVLLIEDGVYAGTTAAAAQQMRASAQASKLRWYALAPDIEARGMQGRVAEGIELVDYAGFVDLVTTNNTVQSWL